MSSVASPAGLVHVGMDTSKKTIMIATLWPGEQVPATERIANEEAAIRRFFGRLGDSSVLRSCYEAGPGGYDLYWLLELDGGGVRCGGAVADPQGRARTRSRRTGGTRAGRRGCCGPGS